MSDENILTGGETAPAPSDIPAAPSPPASSDEPVAAGRHTVLDQLARKENIDDYVDERDCQELYFEQGEELNDQANQKWYRRASRALTDAALEAAGIKLNEQGQQEPQAPPPGYVPGDEAERAITEARKTGAAQMRINQYFGNNQEARDNVTQWHQAMDPQGTVAQWLIDNESSMAGPIMQRTTEHPEALQQLAEMSPSERSRWLSKLEGHLEAEMRFAQQLNQQGQQWQAERRTTKAPPIIRPPRGGANPPQDPYQLAGRAEDVSDYVKYRQKMERRRDD